MSVIILYDGSIEFRYVAVIYVVVITILLLKRHRILVIYVFYVEKCKVFFIFNSFFEILIEHIIKDRKRMFFYIKTHRS